MTDETLNDETNTDDNMTDDIFAAENEDEDEENLHEIPADKDVYVAKPGASVDKNTDDSPTNNVLRDMGVDPPEVDDSPLLFSVDETGQDSTSDSHATKSTTTNSGHKPAKLMEVTIPLRNPTQPTLVSGRKPENKRDNTELSDLETSPKKNKTGSHKKKRK